MVSITRHAYDRIQQRIGFTPFRKLKQIADEVYRSELPLPDWFIRSGNNLSKYGFGTYRYKLFNDMVWVFQLKSYANRTKPYLITVYEKTTKNRTQGTQTKKRKRIPWIFNISKKGVYRTFPNRK